MTVYMASVEDNASSSRFRRFRSSRPFVIATVCLAIFNDVFLFGAIIPILPYALPHRANIDVNNIQIWIAVLLAAYGAALLVGSLLFGWIGDKMRRRRPLFLTGSLCLLMATMLLAFGRHIALLVLGRFLQGLSASIVWTSGLALLADLFGHERFGEAIGYGQTSVSMATTSSPLVGGIVYTHGGWRAVSILSITTVAVSFTLSVLMIEPNAVNEYSTWSEWRSQWRDILNWRKNGGPRDDHSVDSDESSTDTAVPEYADERTELLGKSFEDGKAGTPAYFLLLRSSRILAAMVGIFTYSFAMFSFEGMIPLFVKDHFHWGSTAAALTFLSWIVPSTMGPLVGKLVDRVGSRWIAVGGFLFAIPPIILLRLVHDNNTQQKVVLIVLLTLMGIGLVWIMPACLSDLTAAATDLKDKHPERFGKAGALTQAFGLFVFAYSCGTFVGPAVSGVMKSQLSFGAATLVIAMVVLVATIPIAIFTSSKSRRRAASTSE